MQDNGEGRFYMHSQGDTKAGRSADLYFEVKLVNGVRGSVLNQEIHSAAWSVVFLLPGVPGPVLPQRTFSCKEKKTTLLFPYQKCGCDSPSIRRPGK